MSEWEKRLGFHPSELVNPSDLPEGNPVKYQKDATERAERFVSLLDDIEAEHAAMKAELAELRATVNSLVARPYEIKVEAAPPAITVQASDVSIPAPQVTFSPTIKASPVENVTHVVHAPEKKAKRTGTMQKNKDGTFSFTVEEE